MSITVPELMFSSLAALRAEHRELQRTYRDQAITQAMTLRIEDFIRRGRATGAILDDEEDQAAAQALLDFWGTCLYRSNNVVPDTTLAPFDPSAAPILDDSLVPYVGLGSFTEGEKELFFGRGELVASLVERLRQQNLLAISGPSGSGKSSLVLAGIVPALKNGALPGSKDWRYLGRMVPGSNPFENLAKLLLRGHENGNGAVGDLAEQLKKKPESLRDVLAMGDQGTVVLVIDQFEELSTLCEDNAVREAFEKALVGFAKEGAQSGGILILTMRSDFIGAVARQPELQNLLETGLVPITPLSAAELRAAITRPAERVGLKFETGIVVSLVHDILGEPAALPLLQFTLLKLWEHRDHNRITAEAYRELGGGRLALTRSADKFIHGLIPQERIMAERILLRLVRPGIGQDNVANRIRKVSLYSIDAKENVDRVLNKLVQEHLVRLTEGEVEADSEVEVAHEALVRNWQHLVSLLEAERERMTTLRRLELKAGEWVRLGRGTAGLLRDAALVEAEQWLANPDAESLGASSDLRHLVNASRKAANVARTWASVGRVALVGLLALVAFAIGSVRFAIQARKQTREAEKQRITAQNLNTKLQVANKNLQDALGRLQTSQAQSAADERLHITDMMGDTAESTVPEDPEQASLLVLEAVGTLLDHHQQVSSDLKNILAKATQANHVRVVLPVSSEITSLAFSPDGLRLAAAAKNQPVRIWDAISGQKLADFPNVRNATAIAFSYSGKQIAATLEGRIQVFGASLGEPQSEPHSTNSIVQRLVFSPNDKYVAVMSATGNVDLWSPTSQSPMTPLQNNTKITAIAFDPTGMVIVTGAEDGLVKTWDTDSGTLMQTLLKPEQPQAGIPLAPIRDLAFSPDGWLQIFRNDGTQQRLRFTSSEPLLSGSTVKADFTRVNFGADNALIGLDLLGGNLVRSGSGPTISVPVKVSNSPVAFSLDGYRFAAVPRGTAIKIWDIGPASETNLTQPPGANHQFASNLSDTLDKAVASLTDNFYSPGDCNQDICSGLRTAIFDILDGNRLAKRGNRAQALAKLRSAQQKASWLSHNSKVQQWAQKEFQFIQEQNQTDRAGQQHRGQVAQAQVMLRAAASLDSVPDAGRNAATAAILKQQGINAAATLFRSAAYSAAKQMDEQRVAQWLTRARALAPPAVSVPPSASVARPLSVNEEAQQLIVVAFVTDARKDIQQTLNDIAVARSRQSPIPLDTDATLSNELCWQGSINDGTFYKNPEITDACDRAVSLSQGNPACLDSRGVNRARNGEYAKAIEDLLPYATDPKTPKSRQDARQRWITALGNNQDPFTPDELKRMRLGL